VIGMRALVPELPRDAWALLAGDAICALGSGMTLPFLLVYLHDARGLGLGAAGLAVSAVALAGFAGNPIGGSLADRIGGRATMLAGLVLCAAGSTSLAFASHAWQAFAASATLGFGAAIVWPARTALLAMLVSSERRSSAYALQHAASNAGLGAGALFAALIVDTSSAGTFQALYLLDAASFVAVVPILGCLAVPAREHRAAVLTPARAAYRSILCDRAFRRLWALTALLVGVGYAQYSAAFPAFATGEAGLDAHQLALAFAANTVAVVVAQLPVLGLLRGGRRTSALAFAFAATGIGWGIVLAGGGAQSPAVAATVFAFAMVVLAIGETAVSPSAPALANDLAPDALRGRYNGAYTLAWTTGFAAGPALAGAVLAAGQATALMLGLIAACAVGAAGSLRLARHLPAGVDVVDRDPTGVRLVEPATA
jgi:MFS family permease